MPPSDVVASGTPAPGDVNVCSALWHVLGSRKCGIMVIPVIDRPDGMMAMDRTVETVN